MRFEFIKIIGQYILSMNQYKIIIKNKNKNNRETMIICILLYSIYLCLCIPKIISKFDST